MTETELTQHLESLLPEVLRTGPEPGVSSPVVSLLKIISEVFGELNETIDTLPRLFHPLSIPDDRLREFLPWMASWMSLVLRADWDTKQQRNVLAQILSLYRKRGTKEGLQKYLEIYAGPGVTIKDELGESGLPPFQVNKSSTVGVSTLIGGLPPYYFIVNVAFDTPEGAKRQEKMKAIQGVLEIEKPAHTHYKLNISGPTLQIGKISTIGEDTSI